MMENHLALLWVVSVIERQVFKVGSNQVACLIVCGSALIGFHSPVGRVDFGERMPCYDSFLFFRVFPKERIF